MLSSRTPTYGAQDARRDVWKAIPDACFAFRRRTPKKLEFAHPISDNKSRPFDEISIAFPMAYGRLGDIMPALKLAQGLSREFQDKKIVIYFGQKEDYTVLQKLFPGFDPSRSENKLNGVYVCLRRAGEMKKIMGKKKVCIHTPIKFDKELAYTGVREVPKPEDFFYGAEINLYLTEPDTFHLVTCPEDTWFNEAYLDSGGNYHLILTTGFSPESAGINIDPQISAMRTGADRKKRSELLCRIRAGRELPGNERIVESEWGMMYHFFPPDRDPFRYFQALEKYVEKERGNREVILFDFSSFDASEKISANNIEVWRSFVEYCDKESKFQHILLRDDGVEILGNPGSQVKILYVGIKKNQTLLEVLAQSELPPLLTGDASPAEAASMRLPYHYQAQPWKHDVIPSMLRLAARVLPQEEVKMLERSYEYDHPRDPRLGLDYYDSYDPSHARRVEERYEEKIIEGMLEIFPGGGAREAMEKLLDYVNKNMNLAKNVATLIRSGIEALGKPGVHLIH